MPRRALPWFRFYVEAFHDRKLRRLTPAERWLFVAVLGAARQSPEPGRLMVAEGEPFAVDDLADFAGMPAKAVRTGMAHLERAGVVVSVEGVWEVPRWGARQFESDDVTARTRRYRERSYDVPGNAHGTASDTETDTDTEPSSSSSDSRPLGPPVDNPAQGVPGDVWKLYARTLLARQRAGSVRNPGAWCRAAAARARDEHGEKAARWWATYDVTPQHLADALVDDHPPRTAPRRAS